MYVCLELLIIQSDGGRTLIFCSITCLGHYSFYRNHAYNSHDVCMCVFKTLLSCCAAIIIADIFLEAWSVTSRCSCFSSAVHVHCRLRLYSSYLVPSISIPVVMQYAHALDMFSLGTT